MHISCTGFHQCTENIAKLFTGTVVDVGFQFTDLIFLFLFRLDQHRAKDTRTLVFAFSGADSHIEDAECLRKCFFCADCCRKSCSGRSYQFSFCLLYTSRCV